LKRLNLARGKTSGRGGKKVSDAPKRRSGILSRDRIQKERKDQGLGGGARGFCEGKGRDVCPAQPCLGKSGGRGRGGVDSKEG